MAGMLHWLPQALKAEGVKVVEVAGWATRGKTINPPKVVVAHHTATRPTTSDATVVRLLVDGRPDLPGPLCHVGLGRDGTAYVVAAGKANHAGTGAWQGVTGSVNTFGIEAFNDGLGEPWPAVQLDAYDRIVAAVLRHEGRDASWLCAHREWALPAGRKTDPRGIDMDQMRARVQTLLNPTEETDDMSARIWTPETWQALVDAGLVEGADAVNYWSSPARTDQELAHAENVVIQGLAAHHHVTGDPI